MSQSFLSLYHFLLFRIVHITNFLKYILLYSIRQYNLFILSLFKSNQYLYYFYLNIRQAKMHTHYKINILILILELQFLIYIFYQLFKYNLLNPMNNFFPLSKKYQLPLIIYYLLN